MRSSVFSISPISIRKPLIFHLVIAAKEFQLAVGQPTAVITAAVQSLAPSGADPP